LAYFIFFLYGVFTMRSDIEEHFNTAEPIGLSLSGVMTFFFSVFYFQYHFTRINEMKQRQMTGYPG
jgi:preprotein translocase subunit SecY